MPDDAMMWSSDSDCDEPFSTTAVSSSFSSSSSSLQPQTPAPPPRRRRHRARRRNSHRTKESAREVVGVEAEEEAEAEDVWRGAQWEAAWPRRAAARPVVFAGEDASQEGGAKEGSVGRARSLTDDDLEELKGCVDLGFGFSYHEIPELCGTLPALELCYSMSQRFLDEHPPPRKLEAADEIPAAAPAAPAQPIPNWKISCPGDSPDEVKARLKYWAQAVACTVRLCS